MGQGLKNKSAIEFNHNNIKDIKKICSPLKQFGITDFSYIRFFNGGKRLIVSSLTNWVEQYIQNNFQDITDIQNYVPQDDIRYSFWIENIIHDYAVAEFNV